MKFMSFNTQHCLNYLEQKIDFDIMARAIKECDADVIGLNEMRNAGANAEYLDQVGILSELTEIKEHYFAEAVKFSGVNPYGNGMLSKLPIISVETIIIPDPNPKKYDGYYETRCVLKAKLAGDITVLITHIGLNPDEQENAVKTIIENLAPERCILMGDFNMTLENPILNPIRERMVDTAKYFDQPKLSFPSDKPTIKIDYIFVSPDVEVVAADIPDIVSADHRPHTAEVNFVK